MSDRETIVRYVIHPGLGIARVGNSPDEFFIGPEAPGVVSRPAGGFKDAAGRIKRQAARFRIYGVNEAGEAVREIDADCAQIAWRVHLANRKAIGYQFLNALDLGPYAMSPQYRNASITGDARKRLLIDPGSRTISGRNESGKPEYRFDGGKFLGIEVPLGELRTDERGRLIVLGGSGNSASATGSPATTFANNDGWHDDVSDGPIRATITIDGTSFEAEPAMVAVTPPNFGQGLYGVVTMYDVVDDLFRRDPKFQAAPPGRTIFWVHIFPIFDRLVRSQWVNSGISMLFGTGSPGDLTSPALLARLADPDPAHAPLRTALFRWFRDPDQAAEKPVALPPFYGDGFGDFTGLGIDGLSVTRTQYERLRSWSRGDFDPGPKPGAPRPLEDYPIAEQPHALDRTNLEECLGGPFHPGIELTWTLRRASLWKAPFRLNILDEGVEPRDDYGPILHPAVALGPGGLVDSCGPGTLTRWMGVPWQTDEASCLSGYEIGTYLLLPSFWAARVPNQVLSAQAYARVLDERLPIEQRLKHLNYRQDWLRYFGPSYQQRINDNVAKWWHLGIIAERAGPADHAARDLPDRVWIETGLDPAFSQADPTWQQVLIAESLASIPAPEEAPLAATDQVEREKATLPAIPPRRRLRRDEL